MLKKNKIKNKNFLQMSELDTVIKNAEEIAIQEDEEIIEEVIEEEQVPWLGPTDVMEVI